MTSTQLANAVGGFASVLLGECLAEIDQNEVFSKTEEGAYYSRRMVKEEDIRQKRAIAGRRGGLSSASKQASKTEAKGKHPSALCNMSSVSSKGGVGGNAKRDFWQDAVQAMEGDCLNTADFRTAWLDWIDERQKAGRKAYTRRGVTGQIRKLEKMGHDRAIAAIRHSITEGYAGIFEPSGAGQRQGARPTPRKRTPEDRGEYAEPGFSLDG